MTRTEYTCTCGLVVLGDVSDATVALCDVSVGEVGRDVRLVRVRVVEVEVATASETHLDAVERARLDEDDEARDAVDRLLQLVRLRLVCRRQVLRSERAQQQRQEQVEDLQYMYDNIQSAGALVWVARMTKSVCVPRDLR